jgi:hypothetical protein
VRVFLCALARDLQGFQRSHAFVLVEAMPQWIKYSGISAGSGSTGGGSTMEASVVEIPLSGGVARESGVTIGSISLIRVPSIAGSGWVPRSSGVGCREASKCEASTSLIASEYH